MLDKRIYTRQELIEIYKTNRFDSIKAKLKRQGYTYTISGRGDNATLTIIELPQQYFRDYCINELGYAPQTDFNRLKKFLYRFFFDESFQQLPSTAMAREMEIEFHVTYQTINHWMEKLFDCGMIWRSFCDFNYYSHGRDRDGNVITFSIDGETYKDAWAAYWDGREYGYNESVNRLVAVARGTPQKFGVIYENAFALEKIERLKDILKQEIEIDG